MSSDPKFNVAVPMQNDRAYAINQNGSLHQPEHFCLQTHVKR